jgi:carbohydrate diacid regulator
VLDIEAGPAAEALMTAPLRLVREAFHHAQDVSCPLSPVRYVVLAQQPAPRAITTVDLEQLAGDLGRSVGGRCTVAIGGPASDEASISQSYADALVALRLGPIAGLEQPFDINALRGHQMVLAVPPRSRQRIAESVLGELRRGRDWPTVRDTIIAWVESGFTLVSAAQALSIHRNTLVYRLGRTAERLGLSTSDHRAWLAVYIACVADALEVNGSW